MAEKTSIYAENTSDVPLNVNGSEALRIDANRRLLIGTDTSVATGSSTGGLQLHNTTSASGAHLSVARFNNDSTGGKLVLGKSRSTTVAWLEQLFRITMQCWYYRICG